MSTEKKQNSTQMEELFAGKMGTDDGREYTACAREIVSRLGALAESLGSTGDDGLYAQALGAAVEIVDAVASMESNGEYLGKIGAARTALAAQEILIKGKLASMEDVKLDGCQPDGNEAYGKAVPAMCVQLDRAAETLSDCGSLMLASGCGYVRALGKALLGLWWAPAVSSVAIKAEQDGKCPSDAAGGMVGGAMLSMYSAYQAYRRLEKEYRDGRR